MTSKTRRTVLSFLGGQLLDALIPTAAAAVNEPHTLVYITLNGGMDGLNAVVPHADPDYYAARPNLAVPPPGQSDASAIDLDGFFGLHPRLQPLKTLFDAGVLAIVHATGAPYVDRSHFNATKRMQSGLSTPARSYTGWLARHLDAVGDSDGWPFRGMTIGCAQHEALRGTRAASALPTVNGFDLTPEGGGDYQAALRALCSPQSLLGRQALDTIDVLDTLAFYRPASYAPENGATYPPTHLARMLKQAAQYIKSGMGIEAICIDSKGWDHHHDLARMLPAKLDELAQALVTFHLDMGARMQQVTVMVTTEFGRRVQENASSGADHGRGTCLLALGGRVNGGRVYADWPGLAEYQRNQGDLEITTDFRAVLSEALVRLLGNARPDLVFPDFTANDALNLFSAA